MKLLEGGKDPEQTHFDACQENWVDSWAQNIVWILVDDGFDEALATTGGWKIHINQLNLHWCLFSQVFPFVNIQVAILYIDVLEPILTDHFFRMSLIGSWDSRSYGSMPFAARAWHWNLPWMRRLGRPGFLVFCKIQLPEL